MKAVTRIRNAVTEMYRAYADYSRVVLNIPFVPHFPQVYWKAGNNSNGTHGTWLIDGKEYDSSAQDVIASFGAQTNHWNELRRQYIIAPKADKSAR